MKYLRITMWLGRNAEPMTALMRETDLTVDIHEAATLQRGMAQADGVGGFTEIEVHELPDNLSIEEATMEVAKIRQEPSSARDRHMNTVHDWGLSLLDKLNPGGVAQTTEASPLSVADLREALLKIAAAPNYRGQIFRMTTKDQTEVNLVDGKIETSQLN